MVQNTIVMICLKPIPLKNALIRKYLNGSAVFCDTTMVSLIQQN